VIDFGVKTPYGPLAVDMKPVLTFLFILWIMALGAMPGQAATWRTLDGQSVEAEAVEFDFTTKMVTLENKVNNARANYYTRDLDFKSRRLLLFAPVFHQSFPESTFWPKEKIWLCGLAILSPIFLLIVGMWLAGLFVARRFNPFSAIGAFLGSWIAGVILVICYMVFAQKGNLGNGMIYTGMGIASLVMALFVSAMYRCSFLKGVLIFVGHIVFAAFLAYVIVYGADKIFPPDQVNDFWQQWVYIPTGLVESSAN
jgi:hypothetical protein